MSKLTITLPVASSIPSRIACPKSGVGNRRCRTRGKRDTRAAEALERVGLKARMHHRPSELSGGEQQRAALARALINQPKILLADEPTGNLDSRTGTEIMNLVQSFNQDLGMTVVMVTHERALAERYAQRMIFLADGKLVDDRPNTPSAVEPSLQGGRA